MNAVSRRDLVCSAGALVSSLLLKPFVSSAAPRLQFKLVKEFIDSTAQAFSPDGRRLLLEDRNFFGYRSRVIEIGSWKDIFKTSFGGLRPLMVDFFADGDAIFLEFAPAAKSSGVGQSVIELKTGQRTDRMHPVGEFSKNFDSVHAVFDRTLLICREGKHPRHYESFYLMEFSTGRELLRVQLPSPRSDSLQPWDLVLSEDRKLFTYL